MVKSLFSFLALVLVAADAQAGPIRDRIAARRGQTVETQSFSASQSGCSDGVCWSASQSSKTTTTQFAVGEGGDALDVVNEWRIAHGYRAYVRDEGLTQGAIACARFRAANRIEFHTTNDHAFLPAGVWARSGGAGTGGYGPWGFLSCWAREHGPTHAGAAWIKGADGRMYCQMFVR